MPLAAHWKVEDSVILDVQILCHTNQWVPSEVIAELDKVLRHVFMFKDIFKGRLFFTSNQNKHGLWSVQTKDPSITVARFANAKGVPGLPPAAQEELLAFILGFLQDHNVSISGLNMAVTPGKAKNN